MNQHRFKKDVLYGTLRERISSGVYAPGSKLPPELAFAKELGVGKVTLRSALERLAEEGLVTRVPAIGTFVAPDASRAVVRKVLVVNYETVDRASPVPEVLLGVERAATTLGIQTIHCSRQVAESHSPESFRRMVENEGIGGVIPLMSGFLGHEDVLPILQACGVPVVLPHAAPADRRVTGFATVLHNERAAWADAVSHLTDCGHRRIAVLGLAPGKLRGHSEEELLQLLEGHGAYADSALLAYALYEKPGVTVEACVARWAELLPIPTAIMCYSDFLAPYVYESLQQHELRVPDDVAVIGCGGYTGGVVLDPPLSTVSFMYDQQARLAVELVARRHEWFGQAGVPPPTVVQEHQLVARLSTEVKRVEYRFEQDSVATAS